MQQQLTLFIHFVLYYTVTPWNLEMEPENDAFQNKILFQGSVPWSSGSKFISHHPNQTTPLKINIEPKNHSLKKETHLPKFPLFWGSKCWFFQSATTP